MNGGFYNLNHTDFAAIFAGKHFKIARFLLDLLWNGMSKKETQYALLLAAKHARTLMSAVIYAINHLILQFNSFNTSRLISDLVINQFCSS